MERLTHDEMSDADLVAFHFGEVDAGEREAIEQLLLGDRELLGEYFLLKLHCERPPGDSPSDDARERLEHEVARLFGSETPAPSPLASRWRERWPRAIGVVAVAAAAVGIWFLTRGDPPAMHDGQLIDTARQETVSGKTL